MLRLLCDFVRAAQGCFAVPESVQVDRLVLRGFAVSSPIAMLWGLAKLIGGRAPSGHRQSWWADGVPVMF